MSKINKNPHRKANWTDNFDTEFYDVVEETIYNLANDE